MTETYGIPGYPRVFATNNGTLVSARPMESGDGDALFSFFQKVPEEDRAYLKEDVTSPVVISEWADHLDYARVLPILVMKDDRVIADGTLHRRRPSVRRHVGEVRITVDPEFRNQGIGRHLLRMLLEYAESNLLQKAIIEIVAEKEEPARRAAQRLGFSEAAVLEGHIRDIDGSTHDLVIMEMPDLRKALGTELPDEPPEVEGIYY